MLFPAKSITSLYIDYYNVLFIFCTYSHNFLGFILNIQVCFSLIPPIVPRFINKLSVFVTVKQDKLCWLGKKAADVGTVRGSVSPTVRDRGKCSWPNVHSPAPPSPTSCTERVGRGVYTHIENRHTRTHVLHSADWYSCVKGFTHTHTHTQAHLRTFFSRLNPPGSWHSSARCPQQLPPVVKDPTEPQLSALLSWERERDG